MKVIPLTFNALCPLKGLAYLNKPTAERRRFCLSKYDVLMETRR